EHTLHFVTRAPRRGDKGRPVTNGSTKLGYALMFARLSAKWPQIVDRDDEGRRRGRRCRATRDVHHVDGIKESIDGRTDTSSPQWYPEHSKCEARLIR
ncbi:MAG: hypothetical protein ACRD41_06490, partial [Candidatus Acidiferrales bacterium]